MILPECLYRLVRQIGSKLLESLTAGQDFLPFYLFLPGIGLFDRSVNYADHRPSHLRSDAVTLYQRYRSRLNHICRIYLLFKLFNAEPALNHPICWLL